MSKIRMYKTKLFQNLDEELRNFGNLAASLGHFIHICIVIKNIYTVNV